MSERPADRWLSIGLSVATHLAIAGALIWGYWNYQHPAPKPQQLALEATVVDASSLPPGTLPTSSPASPPQVTAPEPLPEPEPPVPQPPAAQAEQLKAQAAQREQQEQQREAQRAKQAEARARAQSQAEAKPPSRAQAKLAAQAQLKADAKATAAEKAKAEQAQKDKPAREQAAAGAKAAADRKTHEEADRRAREEAERQAREQAEADRQKAQRESDLRARLAAEEHLQAAQASGLLAQYQAQIRARIERAWIRPATAKPGLSCEVRITQVPGGEVVGVKVGTCNGDDSVRQSIETAAYRASPLPLPADPALFDRNLVVTFKPQD